MAWPSALLLVVVAACCGALTVVVALIRSRRRRKAQAAARRTVPLPRVQLRSQVIILDPSASEDAEHEREATSSESSSRPKRSYEAPRLIALPRAYQTEPTYDASVHSAPTREFAAHVEELAALSMRSAPTREISVYEPPTREFAAHLDEPAAPRHVGLPPVSRAATERARVDSGFQPRARVSRERRDEDATLKVDQRASEAPGRSSREELLRLLGPSPTPDLGNIEIYYRLGLVYLASGDDAEARRCFLTVEAISPGYRDAAKHLAQLPFYAPTSSGATPVHYVVTTSAPVARGDAATDRESTRGRRNGR